MKTTTLVAVASFSLFATACGLNPGAQFEGTYSVTGGQNYEVIVNGKSSNNYVPADGASIKFVEGVSSDIVFDDGSGCLIPFNAADFETATAVAGTSCNETASNGMTATVTITSGVAKKSGSTVTLNLNATVSVYYAGSTFPGTYKANLTMTKLTK